MKIFILQAFILVGLTFSTIVSSNPSCNSSQVCFKKGVQNVMMKDFAGAKNFFIKGCDLGLNKSCTAAGDMMKKLGDITNSIKYLTKACDSGEAIACDWLGGIFIEQESSKSEKGLMYKAKACELGHIGACATGGTFYLEKSEYEKAKPLLEKACNSNDQVAISTGCNGLAQLYQSGNAVSEDKKRATELFKKGCETKSPFNKKACGNYKFMNGYTANELEEQERLCLKKNIVACSRVVSTYLDKNDYKEAVIFIKLRCQHEGDNVCEDYDYFSYILKYGHPPGVTSESTSTSTSGNGSSYNQPSAPVCRNERYTQYLPGTTRMVQNTRRVCN